MKGLPFVLLFTAMTFVAWGAYGPVLHHGAVALEHDSMRAFVGVGLAYFLIAVLIPFFVLRKQGESGRWTVTGTLYSLVAGAVGAIGALGIILALGYGGRTVYVMPLVFGFAPVVNTLVTAFLSRSFQQIRPIFIGGIVTAALGAAGVLFFKPAPAAPQPPAKVSIDSIDDQPDAEDEEEMPAKSPEQSSENPSPEDDSAQTPAEFEPSSPAEGDEAVGEATADASSDADTAPANSSADPSAPVDSPDTPSAPDPDADAEEPAEAEQDGTSAPTAQVHVLGIILSIVTAALCWGSYGPVLHIGQAKMEGSRLRPFACVGLAYFFIAVAAPLVWIYSRTTDAGAWTAGGMTWSFLAGVAGAIGALGVILAFNAGGKPYYVMPLIFGFAPVINTFISLSEAGTWSQVRPMFWISLAVVIAGAVTVLTNAPKPKPKPAPA